MEWMGRELPKLTMDLQRRRDEADASTGEAAYRAMWAFLGAVLGEHLPEAVDGQSLASCDLVALQTAYAGVCDAYDEPVREARRRQVEGALSALSTIDLDRLARVADLATSRQVFRNVR